MKLFFRLFCLVIFIFNQNLSFALETNQKAFNKKQERVPIRIVDLNSASRTELMQLPRIGAKTAERIIEFRKKHGPFMRIEEIMNVSGIGESTFQLLKPHISVGAKKK